MQADDGEGDFGDESCEGVMAVVGVMEVGENADEIETELPEGVPELSQKVRRRNRRTRPRSKTIAMKRMTRAELQLGALMYPPVKDVERLALVQSARTRARPCPWVACKHHLYIDVHPVRGSMKINFTDAEVWEMTETCALDIADRGGITLEEVGEIMNLTRERVRQVETAGLAKLAALKDVLRLKDYVM